MKLTLYLLLGSAFILLGLFVLYFAGGVHSFSLLALSRGDVQPGRPAVGVPRPLRGLRHPGGHLAAPHLVARRARLRAHRGLDAPRRRPDEARRLRPPPRGDDAPARGSPGVGAPGGDDRGDQRRLRRLLGDGPDGSQVRRRLLVGVPHGARHAGRRHPDGGRAQRRRLPDVRPRDHDGTLLRAGGAHLREVPHAGDRPDGRVRAADARDRRVLHARRPLVPRPARPRGVRRRDPHLPRRLAVGLPLVALSRGARHAPHRDLRAPRGQADLLGPAGRRPRTGSGRPCPTPGGPSG